MREFAVVLFLAGGVFNAGAIAAPNALATMPNEKTAAHEALDHYLHNSATGGGDGGDQVSFEIDAALPKLKKRGIMRGLRVITVAGRVAFTQAHFVGDELVKSAVINRFLRVEAREGKEEEGLGVTARNYRFRYKGRMSYNDRTVFVFRTEPRKRRVGLFTGELWLDSETARPLREWGEFIKSPSVFLSNICFVRDYVSDSSGSHLLRIILKMRAAFAGPVELTMWLSKVPSASKNGLAGDAGPAPLKASPSTGI
jgi:hypothetical protein